MKASRKVVSARQRSQAYGLRRNLTPTERRLWYALRTRLPLGDSHFRRQVPIGSFIVDFCCHRARLIIEVDGGKHGFDAAQRRDAARTILLEAEGHRVLRSWNKDIWRNLKMVLDTIYTVVTERISTSET